MTNQHIEDTPMGRIVIGIMQITGWFFLCMVVFPVVLLYATVSSSGAFLVLAIRSLCMFLDGMRILIHNFIFGDPAHNNAKCQQFQEVMAKYSRFWLDDTPPGTPADTDDKNDTWPAQHIPPPTMVYLFGPRAVPDRRWMTTTILEHEAQTSSCSDSDSDEERKPGEHRIDKETLALAMRSAMEERESIADGPRSLTLPERRRLRLDRQREASERASLIYQLNHSDW